MGKFKSCENCRKQHKKCDKKTPCGNCIRKGIKCVAVKKITNEDFFKIKNDYETYVFYIY